MPFESDSKDSGSEVFPKTESGGGGERPPRGTALGASDGGESPDYPAYKRGENLDCEIVNARPGGYSVFIQRDRRFAFFQTAKQYAIGAVVCLKFSHYQDYGKMWKTDR